MSLTMSSFFAGRSALYDNGQFVGSISKNIFGGVDYRDTHGVLTEHTSQFGHQTNVYDKSGHSEGYYRQNIHGGHDFYGENGTLTSHSASNIHGGYNVFDHNNILINHSTPNINGGLDWHDASNIAEHSTISSHIDSITDFFHHHMES